MRGIAVYTFKHYASSLLLFLCHLHRLAIANCIGSKNGLVNAVRPICKKDF
jgi:hypothetical protein